MNKGSIRAWMKEKRAGLSREEQASAADAASQRILASAFYREARTVMAYAAARGELSLDAVLEDALISGRRLVLPRCEAPGVMTARQITAISCLKPAAYGLMEPGEECRIVPPQEIDLILVPGTAFDPAGRRIGQGGGYYDRFLPRTGAVRIGVCHDFALLDHLNTEAHDQTMDAVCTPGGLHPAGNQRKRSDPA